MIHDLYAPLPPGTDMDARHLFVSLDGAAVWWYSHDDAVTGDWIQTYAFGDEGRTASRAFRSIGVPHRPPALEEHTVINLTDRYLTAWNRGAPDAFEDVYADGAAVIDDLRHTAWRGRADIATRAADRDVMELGPWPSVFTYRSGGHVEAIVLLQTDGACPMLEARRAKSRPPGASARQS